MQHISQKLPMVDNIPVSTPEFKDAIEWAANKAKNSCEDVIISWSGLYDVRVFPNGNFQFISNEVPIYQIISDTHLEVVNH